MKLFAYMSFCLCFGIVIGVAFRQSDQSRKMVEVCVERIVTTPEDHTMRFHDLPVPYTVLVYRPPQKRWAVPGVVGELNSPLWAVPPAD